MLALTKIAARRAPEGRRERANLEIVHRASERARDLLKQILSFSCDDVVEMQPVSLADIVRWSIGMRASIPTTIRIVTRLPTSRPSWATAVSFTRSYAIS